jgi:hypothetical protein
VAGCCECSDEPSGSCATELVSCHTTFSVLHSQPFVDIRNTDFYKIHVKVLFQSSENGCPAFSLLEENYF